MSFHSTKEFFSVIENGDFGSRLTRLLNLLLDSCILQEEPKANVRLHNI